MIKLLICDDNIRYANNMKKLIHILSPEIFRIYISTNDSINIQDDFDVIFLCIESLKVNGFVIANKIYNRNPECLLVFLSNYEELSMEGYRYHAYRFISKERVYDMLPIILKDIYHRFTHNKQYIIVKDGHGVQNHCI